MKYFFLVAMSDSFEQLIGEALDDVWLHALFFGVVIHELFQIVLQIFEDQNEFAISVDDFSQIDDVDVVQFFQNGDFSDGGGRDALFFRF